MNINTCADCKYGKCNFDCKKCNHECTKNVNIKNEKNITLCAGKCSHYHKTKNYQCDKYKQCSS
jgi:hypothetical protein